MPAFQPTADQFRAFRDDPYDGPIAQVNLLEFRVTSAYGADEVGASCVLYGEVERSFIGHGDWDAVLVMHFPSRAASIQTFNHPDYHAMHRHRDAGLLCRELLTARPAVSTIGA